MKVDAESDSPVTSVIRLVDLKPRNIGRVYRSCKPFCTFIFIDDHDARLMRNNQSIRNTDIYERRNDYVSKPTPQNLLASLNIAQTETITMLV